ncbi:MAG: TatD family hydrolase [Clostridia bacterium]|nr:TatD family hydrolase [Clostridia bacterium]
MRIFDTHAHYDDDAFDSDRDEVISSLPSFGVELVMNVGCDLESSKKAAILAEKYPFMHASAGIHPHEAAKVPSDWEKELTELLALSPAVGEIGLDYHYDFSPREVQREIFDAQLSIAQRLDLPVIIHQRESTADTLDILSAHKGLRGVVHCFSGSLDTAKTLLSLGYHLGFGGALTFKNALKAPEVMEYMPEDRILFETDCPYMTPVPYRGKRNFSGYVPLVVLRAAEIRRTDPEALSLSALENGRSLFFSK